MSDRIVDHPSRAAAAQPWLVVAVVLAALVTLCCSGAAGGLRLVDRPDLAAAPGRATGILALDPTLGEPAPACAFGEVDRAIVLDMVRLHRRGTAEATLRGLADAIFEEALAAEVDPLMVASIVARESGFRTRVVSHAGAVGLMQLRPFVARDVASRLEVEWSGLDTLHRPDLNVRLGLLYYKELVERFDGELSVALTAYNYGPTRVSRQLRQGTYRSSSYAKRILDLYDEWKLRRDRPVARDARIGSVSST